LSNRALIVDDHPIVRNALVTSLVSLEVFDDLETAGSFQELIEKLEADSDYRLLILDLSLTDISGADGLIYIRENYPDIPVVVFSGHTSADVIAACFDKGVHGFVSKNSSMQVFTNAIRIVLSGSTYIPPEAVNLMGLEAPVTSGSEPGLKEKSIEFSPKQRQVFDQLVRGMPNKVIATQLNMAEGTVKAHLHSIYQILQVTNRAQAILRARELQISE
jgi:DNA-binding NarL/FixJ family response regulator